MELRMSMAMAWAGGDCDVLGEGEDEGPHISFGAQRLWTGRYWFCGLGAEWLCADLLHSSGIRRFVSQCLALPCSDTPSRPSFAWPQLDETPSNTCPLLLCHEEILLHMAFFLPLKSVSNLHTASRTVSNRSAPVWWSHTLQAHGNWLWDSKSWLWSWWGLLGGGFERSCGLRGVGCGFQVLVKRRVGW